MCTGDSEADPRAPPRLWVFGYGSLIWKPDLPFDDARDCFVRDLTRRFYQGSTDHRGVPGAPGRVVTLLEESDAECWGRAYRVAHGSEHDVLQRLDHREKGGYKRLRVRCQCADSTMLEDVLVYVATEDNEEYLGAAPLEDMAAQIARASGPSGPNTEYLFRLAEALRAMGAHDAHVFALEECVASFLTPQ